MPSSKPPSSFSAMPPTRYHQTSSSSGRHYCTVCNAWMGSDRASIALHENGKKHREMVQQQIEEKRRQQGQQEAQARMIQSSLQSMETAARNSLAEDLIRFVDVSTPILGGIPAPSYLNYSISSSTSTLPRPPVPYPISSTSATDARPPPSLTSNNHTKPANDGLAKKSQMKEWESRKRQREEERQKGKIKHEDDDDVDTDGNPTRKANRSVSPSSMHHRGRVVGSEEGYYTVPISTVTSSTGTIGSTAVSSSGNTGEPPITEQTYLEGVVFGELLEPDMPVEIWRGPALATTPEQRSSAMAAYWTKAIVIRRRRRQGHPPQQQPPDQTTNSNGHGKNEELGELLVDVAYLSSTDDTEETVEQFVPMTRIRIPLGGDDLLPESILEARLMAHLEDEVRQIESEAPDSATPTIDESTGLSQWRTVSIKRTTVRKELQEERARLREARRQAALERIRQEKIAEIRRMEEAAVANAEDSALGAFDVWNRGAQTGYKGVDIHTESVMSIHEYGKKLASDGEQVSFQKRAVAFKAKGKKQNQRRTSADDD